MTYFRVNPPGEDPQDLLDPSRGSRPPWDPRGTRPCGKCGGTGRALHECGSCVSREPDDTCPACAGRVRFEDTCPACEGRGRVATFRLHRDGVSVFPDEMALYRYLIAHDACLTREVDLERVRLALGGERAA